MSKTAVVTGGAGFIGKALTRRLVLDGWNVVVIDDMSTHMTHDYPDEGVKFIQGRTQDAILREHDVHAIFHLAGKVGPVGVLRWAGHIAQDTIDAADKAGGWAAFHNCPLIDISTSEIYGSPDASNAEDDPKVFPYTASARMEYATAKLAAETMLLNRDMLDIRIVRPFNVAGPGQKPEGGFVLPRFIIQALTGRPLTVYLPGTQKRAFTHVDDLVEGIMLVYEKGQKGQAYNLGNPHNETTMTELAMRVVAHVGQGRVEFVDPNEIWGPDFREAADKVPNADRAMALGWKPKHSLDRVVADAVDYWKGMRLVVPV
jgi:UDP-glucose 4-epimerase